MLMISPLLFSPWAVCPIWPPSIHPALQLVKKLSASVHQIEYFDKIILRIIADMGAVTLIVLPRKTKLISDKAALAALDYEGGGRKSSLRHHQLASPSPPAAAASPAAIASHSTSRKSSKRDSRVVTIVEPDVIVSCDEYFSMLDAARNHRMAELRRRYESIGPLLIKLESLVLGTATGESFKMSLYYQHWEGMTFAGLVRLVKSNLNEFIRVLDEQGDPLFQVDAQLQLPEIVLRPNPNEIYEIVFESVKDFLHRIKALKRWQHGSCLHYEEKRKAAGRPGNGQQTTTPSPPSFIDDIIGDEAVATLLVKIQERVKDQVKVAKEYLIR